VQKHLWTTISPVNRRLQGFFSLSCTLATTLISDASHVHNTTKRPNRRPRQPPTLLLPTSPTWKPLKSASMSQQRRRMALSASNDVAGTWKCFSAAFSSATCSSIIPYAPTTIPSHQMNRKGKISRVVKNHPRISCSFKPPNDSATHGTTKGDP